MRPKYLFLRARSTTVLASGERLNNDSLENWCLRRVRNALSLTLCTVWPHSVACVWGRCRLPLARAVGLRRGVVSDCHCPSSRSSSRESFSPQWPAGSQSSVDAPGRPGSSSALLSARSPSGCCSLPRPAVARHAGLERAVGRADARDAASNSRGGERARRATSLVRQRGSPRLRLSRSVVLDVWLRPGPRQSRAADRQPRSGAGPHRRRHPLPPHPVRQS
jgi:hypothetical protein